MPRKHPPPHRTHKAPRAARTPRQQDSAYKLLFSQAAMVRSLLLLIAAELVAELDLDTLERLPGEHVARGGQKRFSDIVWKVQRKGRINAPCYIAILLEFQSTPDRFMALRLLTYVALLLEERKVPEETLKDGGLAAQLIRLEQAGDPKALRATVGAFLAGLHDDDREVLTAAIRLLVGDTCRRLGIPWKERSKPCWKKT